MAVGASRGVDEVVIFPAKFEIDNCGLGVSGNFLLVLNVKRWLMNPNCVVVVNGDVCPVIVNTVKVPLIPAQAPVPLKQLHKR